MQQNTNPNPDPVEETSLDIARSKTRKMQHLQQNPDREEGPSSAAYYLQFSKTPEATKCSELQFKKACKENKILNRICRF